MKKTILFISASLLVMAIGCQEANKENATTTEDTATTAAAAPAEEAAPPMDSAAMMKAWMDYMTPGDQHSWLAKSEGNWKGEVTMWEDPSKPPTTSTMTSTNKMIMGGRYLQGVAKGNMNGQPFEGTATMGYDNAKKKFVSTWIDNMGTGVMQTSGTYDEASKTLTLTGTSTDCTNGGDMAIREVTTYTDEKNHTWELYTTMGGKEMKTMEIKYTKM